MTLKDRIIVMPHVSSVSDERGCGDGVWVYYKDGFKSSSDPVGACHMDHEDTWTALYSAAKDVMPCECLNGCLKVEVKI